MNKMITTGTVIFIAVFCLPAPGLCSSCCATADPGAHAEAVDSGAPLDDILDKLGEATGELKTYEAKIEYLFVQDPELLDSRTLRKGELYYAKNQQGSKLRINFNTRKQDDEEEEKYIQQFAFDGIWLTRVDYQLEKVDREQKRPEDDPADVFEFISSRFPLIGFTKTETLRRQFEIALLPRQKAASNLIGLHLKPKKDSIYAKNYKTIGFWLDKDTFLPAMITAESTEEDIFEIQLLQAKANKKLKNSVFKLEPPKHFDKNITPLKKK